MTDKTEAPELKPCPFCGGEAEMRTAIEEAIIECTDCGLTMDHWDDSDTSPAEVCAAMWNTRTPPSVCAEVKPLVWGGKAGSGDYHAKCSLTGRWMVFHMPNNVFIADGPDGRAISDHDNETDALRACEENRLTRILLAITARSASEVHKEGYDAGRAEALEEAARNIPSIMYEKGPFAPDIAKGIRALNKEQFDD